jgi:prevent-host-death family protein
MDSQVTEIGAFEAKTKFSALLDRVEKGEEIVITRKGLAIAKLVRFERVPTVTERQAAIERISRLAGKRTLKGISWKTLRDTGRKY